ncbi:hypothetical protein HC928_01450 [bacterium]|nr:hypothetical protein [bacterium]
MLTAPTLAASAIRSAAQKQAHTQFVTESAADFLEAHVYDPEAGTLLQLEDEQRVAINF